MTGETNIVVTSVEPLLPKPELFITTQQIVDMLRVITEDSHLGTPKEVLAVIFENPSKMQRVNIYHRGGTKFGGLDFVTMGKEIKRLRRKDEVVAADFHVHLQEEGDVRLRNSEPFEWCTTPSASDISKEWIDFMKTFGNPWVRFIGAMDRERQFYLNGWKIRNGVQIGGDKKDLFPFEKKTFRMRSPEEESQPVKLSEEIFRTDPKIMYAQGYVIPVNLMIAQEEKEFRFHKHFLCEQ